MPHAMPVLRAHVVDDQWKNSEVQLPVKTVAPATQLVSVYRVSGFAVQGHDISNENLVSLDRGRECS